MTGEREDEGGGTALEASVDEEFLHTVVSEDVLAAWEALQAAFQQFLGRDNPGAWLLVKVTHRPSQKVDGDGNPTGEWELVSSGEWKRDPEVPTPGVAVAIADELPELSELERQQA